MAVNCGTPTPAMMRVVQIEPGPTPTLTAETPALISASVPSPVATLPPMIGQLGEGAPQLVDRLEHHLRVAVGGVHHHDVHAGVHQRLGALQAVWPHADGGTAAQASQGILAGVREALALLDVLDGDEAAQGAGVVHHQELLDAVLVEQVLRLLHARARRHGHQVLARS